MSNTLIYSEPLNNLLYRDEEIAITTGRIEVKGASYVTKYISSVHLHEGHPSRKQGWTGLIACAIGSLALLIYLYVGKISVGTYVVAYVILVVVAIAVMLYLVLDTTEYKLEFSLINHESIEITRKKEVQILEIHAALKQAIAYSRQDPPDHPHGSHYTEPASAQSLLSQN